MRGACSAGGVPGFRSLPAPAIAAALCVLAAGCCSSLAAGELPGSGGSRELVLRNVAVSGRGFEAQSGAVRLMLDGDSASPAVSGIELSDFGLTIGKEASFSSGGPDAVLPAGFPVITVERGEVFVKDANLPPALFHEKISFGFLRVFEDNTGSITAEARCLSSGGWFRHENITLSAAAEEDAVKLRLAGSVSGGVLEADVSYKPASGKFSARGGIDGLLLQELKTPRAEEMAGKITLDCELSGLRGDLSSLAGSVSVKLEDGSLWNVPVLHGLSTIVLKVDAREAPFLEGAADFRVEDGVFFAENAYLAGDSVVLMGRGSVRADGRVDFNVASAYTEEFLKSIPASVEMATHLLKAADSLLIRYRIGGTVSSPVYEVVPLPIIVDIPGQLKRLLGFLLPLRGIP